VSLRGVGVSPGIVIGRAAVVEGARLTIPRRHLTRDECPAEITRFTAAVATAKKALLALAERARRDLGEEPAHILDTHLLMLDDDGLVGETVRQIESTLVNAEWALNEVLERLARQFRSLDDEILRERLRDVQDVGESLQSALSGSEPASASQDSVYILVAHDPSPSDAARLDPRWVQGMVVDVGGRTSHTGIIARSLEIPTVIGVGRGTREVRTGDQLIVDGSAGEVFINPSRTLISEYENKRAAYLSHERELLAKRDLPSVTADGHKIFLQANVDLADEVESAVSHGAEGIGLFRSEFLYVNAATVGLPTEDEQYQMYRTLAERVYPRSAIVRTIDFGGGKVTPVDDGAVEANPIMGLRAIRYCLQHEELFATQLRALLRASVHGRLKIMFPLITSVSELRQAKAALERARAELQKAGTPFNDALNVGIMIEVPAAAAIADILAREVDFFSIGTNDLIQFFLAIDRDNAAVSYLYEPLHPGVLRTLKYIVESGHRHGIRVGMCGEMASEARFVPLLIGLGLDELSMNPVAIPLVKNVIRAVDRKEAIALADHVLGLSTAQEVEEYLLERLVSKFPHGYL